MRRYLQLLRHRDFALLWGGATVSTVGDGMTLVALVWLVLERTGSAAAVGWLTVAYSAPVIIGGLAAGVLLDRFDRRLVMALDTLGRGLLMASVPLLEATGGTPTWWLFVVAAGYGLLKMIPLAGVPTMIPTLVKHEDLTTANAMESISYGVGGIVGPALAGVLIATVGAPVVIGIDAITYFVFLACLALMSGDTVQAPAPETAPIEWAPTPKAPPPPMPRTLSLGLREAARVFIASPAILATTLMFMAANVGEGMFMVILPIYAVDVLQEDAAAYGSLLAVLSLGALAGSVAIGAIRTPRRIGRAVAAAQVITGAVLLGFVARPSIGGSIVLAIAFGLAASPLTIWAQTIRMRVIPTELRGRVFALLRTLMQSTPPIGGIVAGFLLAGGQLDVALVVAAGAVAVPGLLGLVARGLGEASLAREARETVPAA